MKFDIQSRYFYLVQFAGGGGGIPHCLSETGLDFGNCVLLLKQLTTHLLYGVENRFQPLPGNT